MITFHHTKHYHNASDLSIAHGKVTPTGILHSKKNKLIFSYQTMKSHSTKLNFLKNDNFFIIPNSLIKPDVSDLLVVIYFLIQTITRENEIYIYIFRTFYPLPFPQTNTHKS